MKKIIGLIIVALMIIGIVGGGTLAAFRNIEPSPNNTFAAGTLNLTVDAIDDGIGAAKFTVTNANPGQTGAGTWTLVNAGNLAGFIDLESIGVTNAEHFDAATDQAETADDLDGTAVGGELGANMDVVLWVDNGVGVGGIANDRLINGDEVTIYSGKLGTSAGAVNSIATHYEQNLPLAANNGTTYISMTWTVDIAVNNTIMGDSATLDLTFELAQTAAQ